VVLDGSRGRGGGVGGEKTKMVDNTLGLCASNLRSPS
jgi:hypothetical protein